MVESLYFTRTGKIVLDFFSINIHILKTKEVYNKLEKDKKDEDI
jgi:hypothetical protein